MEQNKDNRSKGKRRLSKKSWERDSKRVTEKQNNFLSHFTKATDVEALDP